MMWPTTAAFTLAVGGDHQIATSVEVWYAGDLIGGLTPTGGTVSVDRTRDTRRTLALTVADPDATLMPTAPTDPLAPYGQTLRCYRGVKLPTGDEMVPIGVFRLVKVAGEAPSGQITVEGEDLSQVIRRNRWTTPYRVDPVDAATAIEDLITDRYPDVVTDFDLTGYTVGGGWLEAGSESDPWRDAQDLAVAAGFELAFGPDGVARLYQPQSPDSAPVAAYPEGSVIVSATRELDTATTYNGVYAYGESSELTTPVFAEAWDDDTASPTYRYGPFGEVPRFFSSPFISTTDQAEAAAQSLLSQVTGGVEQIAWSQIVNPAHDVDDVIDLVVDQLHVAARIVIDTLEIPLSADGVMTATARTRRFG